MKNWNNTGYGDGEGTVKSNTNLCLINFFNYFTFHF